MWVWACEGVGRGECGQSVENYGESHCEYCPSVEERVNTMYITLYTHSARVQCKLYVVLHCLATNF